MNHHLLTHQPRFICYLICFSCSSPKSCSRHLSLPACDLSSPPPLFLLHNARHHWQGTCTVAAHGSPDAGTRSGAGRSGNSATAPSPLAREAATAGAAASKAGSFSRGDGSAAVDPQAVRLVMAGTQCSCEEQAEQVCCSAACASKPVTQIVRV